MSDKRVPNTYAVQAVAEIENLMRDAADILVEAVEKARLDIPQIIAAIFNFRDIVHTAANEGMRRKAAQMMKEARADGMASVLADEVEKFLKDTLRD